MSSPPSSSGQSSPMYDDDFTATMAASCFHLADRLEAGPGDERFTRCTADEVNLAIAHKLATITHEELLPTTPSSTSSGTQHSTASKTTPSTAAGTGFHMWRGGWITDVSTRVAVVEHAPSRRYASGRFLEMRRESAAGICTYHFSTVCTLTAWTSQSPNSELTSAGGSMRHAKATTS